MSLNKTGFLRNDDDWNLLFRWQRAVCFVPSVCPSLWHICGRWLNLCCPLMCAHYWHGWVFVYVCAYASCFWILIMGMYMQVKPITLLWMTDYLILSTAAWGWCWWHCFKLKAQYYSTMTLCMWHWIKRVCITEINEIIWVHVTGVHASCMHRKP